MKKIMFFAVCLCATAFVSCGGQAGVSEAVDSTASDSVVDTTVVADTACVDSVVAE